jgi:preprotein translocase subunit SecE
MNKLIAYLKESRIELTKVVWPTRDQARNHTLLVIGISTGIALYIALIDYVFGGVFVEFIKFITK